MTGSWPRGRVRRHGRRDVPGGGSRLRPRAAREAGVVTLELALGMVSFALLLLLSITAIATGVDHVQCSEASRVGARLAARSEPLNAIVSGALAVAPDGSRVSVQADGTTVTVTVRAPARAPFAELGWDVAAVGRSVAPMEDR